MGFFKRIFSIGSKKSKRKNTRVEDHAVDANGRIVQVPEPWQQEDGDATRLLRSSSAHFAVVSEIDYSLLPPLPHPINSIASTPAASPAKSAASVQRRGTYTVRVLERKLESRTEFPNANPPIHEQEDYDPLEDSPLRKRVLDPRRVPFTPRDQGRLLRLRQDPSVASLLNMYDDQGRISSTAFSNTPSASSPIVDVPGRQQIKRSGSTLRQLLGEPELVPEEDFGGEGDISWAERYLSEHAESSCSLPSTAPVETPKDTPLLPDDPSTKPVLANFTFVSDASQEMSCNHPAISSMEVNLSGATEEPEPEASIAQQVLPETPRRAAEEPKTPMRAAEVFGFLTERRKSVLERQKSQLERSRSTPLMNFAPEVPPKDTMPTIPITYNAKINPSPDTSETSMRSSAQIHTATVTKVMQVLNPLSRSTDAINVLYSQHATPYDYDSAIPEVKPTVQHTGSSATTTSTSSTAQSKIPRGPRPLPNAGPSSRPDVPYQPRASASSEAPLTRHAVPQKTRNVHASSKTASGSRSRIPKHSPTGSSTPGSGRHRHKRRVTSHSSSVMSNGTDDGENSRSSKRGRKADKAEQRDKENSPPSTGVPLRTIFDMRHPNLVKGEPPSPASSADLSPMAKDMMMNLRKQRMRAREEMRPMPGRASRRLS